MAKGIAEPFARGWTIREAVGSDMPLSQKLSQGSDLVAWSCFVDAGSIPSCKRELCSQSNHLSQRAEDRAP